MKPSPHWRERLNDWWREALCAFLGHTRPLEKFGRHICRRCWRVLP